MYNILPTTAVYTSMYKRLTHLQCMAGGSSLHRKGRGSGGGGKGGGENRGGGEDGDENNGVRNGGG